MTEPLGVLTAWIDRRAAPDARAWLAARREALRAAFSERDFTIAFGMVPRKLGRADLDLTAQEATAADAARPGWDAAQWSLDHAARVALMVEFGGAGAPAFHERFARMTAEADVAEAIALYRGLPLYPDAAALVDAAAEGLRTNMLAVFEAVAHRSPFPKDTFDERRWNHMVLKALFVGSYLAPIQGLDERANADLAVMLIDTARERRAAGRPVSFELWRCVGPFARQDMIADIAHELAHGDALGRQGAALALAAAPHNLGRGALDTAPDLAARIASGDLTWARLSRHAAQGLHQHFARPEEVAD